MSSGREAVAPRSILVRCPNWLGDVVMCTPGLRELRRLFPRARIVAQLPSAMIPLLEGTELTDELWPLASRGGGLRGWQADVSRIRAADFDLGVVIPESISSALLMRLGGVRHVLGFARDPLRRALLHQEVIALPEWGRRRLVSKERFVLELLSPLGAARAPLGAAHAPLGAPRAPLGAARGAVEERTRLTLAVTKADEDRLAAALQASGVGLAELERMAPVVLAPGASFGDAKCWPADSFAALADRLASRGLPLVLLGAPGEQARIAAIRRAMDSDPIVLDGVLDLGGLKALLQSARALVANDAGARHIAAAFGVPSVVFFGPTSVAKTADNLAAIEVLETEHACRPCYRRSCPIDHRCLRSIGVDQAEAACDRALSRTPLVAPLPTRVARPAVGGPLR